MKERVITSLALAPVIMVACLIRSAYPLFIVCLLVATLGFWELRQLVRQPKALPVLTLFALSVPFFGTEIQPNRDPVQLILYAFGFWVLGLAFLIAYLRKGRTSSAGADVGGLWIAMPLTCVLMLHRLEPMHSKSILHGAWPLLIVIPVWAGDICGMLAGRFIGRHALAPSVSPGKTWEGAIANLTGSVVTALLLCSVIADPKQVWKFAACGATIGIFGQLGDLFESSLKRRSGKKDSGSILPGHGGILDRIDSLLFAAPVASLVLAFFG